MPILALKHLVHLKQGYRKAAYRRPPLLTPTLFLGMKFFKYCSYFITFDFLTFFPYFTGYHMAKGIKPCFASLRPKGSPYASKLACEGKKFFNKELFYGLL